jgi:lipoprotein-anchoring transpeptidase ErfK/SrfK
MQSFTRRNFLKLSAASMAAWFPVWSGADLPPDELEPPVGVGRVTVPHIRLYREPSYRSEGVGWRRRDQIFPLHQEITSPAGPAHNPRWYRITGGYAHSAYIQRVEDSSLNPIILSIPESGCLGELTVPFSNSIRRIGSRRWEPLYRVYFQTIHWVTGIVEGPDSRPWYEMTDELLHVRYHVPAEHIRLIPTEEYAPLSTHVPAEDKIIYVSLSEQTLTAYEGDQVVFQTHISSGIPSRELPENGIPTDTPVGSFRVASKMPSKHMGDGELTSDYQAYELLGVPWSCFFVSTGVAFHGTYWHDNFGSRMSHGCVNMRNSDALWLYRWTTPEISPGEWYVRGNGTRVHVLG